MLSLTIYKYTPSSFVPKDRGVILAHVSTRVHTYSDSLHLSYLVLHVRK